MLKSSYMEKRYASETGVGVSGAFRAFSKRWTRVIKPGGVFLSMFNSAVCLLYCTVGIRSEATGKSTGRPRKTTADVDAQMVEIIRADPFKTCARIKQELGLQVSAKTVSRRLHAGGFCARKPRKVRKLQPHHVEARIRFAEEHLAASIFWWSKIIYSDESRINLDGSDGTKYVWRFPNQTYHPKNTLYALPLFFFSFLSC